MAYRLLANLEACDLPPPKAAQDDELSYALGAAQSCPDFQPTSWQRVKEPHYQDGLLGLKGPICTYMYIITYIHIHTFLHVHMHMRFLDIGGFILRLNPPIWDYEV